MAVSVLTVFSKTKNNTHTQLKRDKKKQKEWGTAPPTTGPRAAQSYSLWLAPAFFSLGYVGEWILPLQGSFLHT